MRSCLEPTVLEGVPFGRASRLRTVIRRSGPENGGIHRWKVRVTFSPSWRDGELEDMIVSTRPERGIKEEGNQIKLGKQDHETLSPVAMSPTNVCLNVILQIEDYGLKVSINTELNC